MRTKLGPSETCQAPGLGTGFPCKKVPGKLALLDWWPGSLKAFTIKTIQNARIFAKFFGAYQLKNLLGIGFPNKKAQKKSELALLEWGPGSLKAFTIKTLQNAEFFVFFVLLLLEAVTRGTKNSTKGALEKHDLEHEGGARKARSGARFGARRGRSKSMIWSTIWSTKGALKKHDLEHEGGARKARFGARFGARRGLEKHD